MRNTLCIALMSTSMVLAAASPMAFAQDNTASTTPHRFNATIGYAHQIPKTNPGNVAGAEADLDGSGAATLSGSWCGWHMAWRRYAGHKPASLRVTPPMTRHAI